MTLCPRCKGSTMQPPGFLGEAPQTCDECGGTGTVLTNGELEWIWLAQNPLTETHAPPQIVLESGSNRHLSLAEARRVAARIVELADWGERVEKRLKEMEDVAS